MQALEKTVTSRERVITEAARALQATARTALHKAEPLTQVGVSFGAGTWGRSGLPGVFWEPGFRGRRGRNQSRAFHFSSASPKTPENSQAARAGDRGTDRGQDGQAHGSTQGHTHHPIQH